MRAGRRNRHIENAQTLCMKFVAFVCLILFTSGCTKSPPGTVEELVKTRPPTFSGQSTISIASPSNTYLLQGECDPISYGLEYSFNNSSWTQIAGGCANSAFQITVIFARTRKVYVRAKTKTGYTGSAVATIRLALPPTSPQLSFVNGGSADAEDERGMQSGLESLSTPFSDTTGSVKVQSSIVDVIYEP